MLSLPNGCSCSNLSVFPKNWEKGKPQLTPLWYITYRFYDPDRPKPKQVVIKGMNAYKTLRERRAATQALLDNEKDLLFNKGYNPFLRKTVHPVNQEGDISPDTPMIKAFEMALKRLSVVDRVRDDMTSVINGLARAARQIGIQHLEIDRVTRKHIKSMLEKCWNGGENFGNSRYNAYRGYLMMLFKELVEQEAVQMNPVRDISKKPVIQKIKKTLSPQQRKQVDQHLAETFPDFRMFMHLFFHSGGRMPELIQLKPPMVDLARQVYRCVVKKGKQYREVERTIKNVALPYWRHFLDACPDDHYLFGKRLRPGLMPCGVSMACRYWNRYVKGPLGIDVDFYSLKHLNTTQVVDALDEQAAAAQNAHTSTAMVVNIYDVRQRDRQHERLKEVNNEF